VWPRRWFLTQAELSHVQCPEKDETPQGYIRRTLILLRYRSRARVLQFVGLIVLFGGLGVWGYLASWRWRWGQLLGVAVCLCGIALLGSAAKTEGEINLALQNLGTQDDLS